MSRKGSYKFSCYACQSDSPRETCTLENCRGLQAKKVAEENAKLVALKKSDEWYELLEMCGNVCARCGAAGQTSLSGTWYALAADHIIPFMQGGATEVWNIQPLCTSCNKVKRSRHTDYRPLHVQVHFKRPVTPMPPTFAAEGISLYHGDCLEVLKTIPGASVDAVISDPPYPEIDRPYGRLTEEQWHTLMRGVVAETRRILKPSGSAVFVLQPNSEKIGRMRPWLFEFQAWVCREWNMIQDAWWWNISPIPEALAIQGKLMRPSLKACVWIGEPNCYRNQDAVLWQESKENIADRTSFRASNGRNEKPSGHGTDNHRMAYAALERGGVTPMNVFPCSNDSSANGAGAFGHPAGTPYALCDWWTRYIAKPGGVILDMFCGSGTVGIAAVKNGCSFIGIERDEDYFCMMQKRIVAARQQNVLPLFE